MIMARDIKIFRVIYVAIVLSTWFAGIAFYLYAELVLHDPRAPIVLLLIVPLAIFSVLMILNVFLFPIRYGVLGKCSRTLFPNESPQIEIRYSWIRVCQFNSTCPTVTWRVYRTGLGIEIWGFGKVFIPADCIVAAQQSLHGLFCITHISQELRNPVLIPSKVFCKALEIWRQNEEMSNMGHD
jgi:hypothetical protein